MTQEKWAAVLREPIYSYGAKVKTLEDLRVALAQLHGRAKAEALPMIQAGRFFRVEPTVTHHQDLDSGDWLVKIKWRFWPEGFTEQDVEEMKRLLRCVPLV